MRLEYVVEELLALPMRDVDEARGGAPTSPGVYAWWCKEAAVPAELPAPRHPTSGYRLLYIGVAPNGPNSSRNLRQRLRQHTAANIGGSSFRLSLTALLWEHQAWRPMWTDRPALDTGALAALSQWQRDNLRVRWCEASDPWAIEAAVIALMRPPMNRTHNQRHPFYTSMGVARNNLRQAARHFAGVN